MNQSQILIAEMSDADGDVTPVFRSCLEPE
jgi:hypothetical protein